MMRSQSGYDLFVDEQQVRPFSMLGRQLSTLRSQRLGDRVLRGNGLDLVSHRRVNTWQKKGEGFDDGRAEVEDIDRCTFRVG